MPNGSPRNGKRSKVNAVPQAIENHAVGLGGIEAMDPHALDLGSDLGVVVANLDCPLEGGEWVTVHSRTSWTVNELVKRVAFSPIGEFSPSLGTVSMARLGECLGCCLPLHPSSGECRHP